MSVEVVLSHLTGRQVETFYVLLVSSGKYSFLPELYDIFGRETTIKFLEVFAGCKISVPKIEKLEELAKSTTIYVRVERARAKQRPAIIKVLAEEYDISEDRIRSIYAKTKVKLEKELGFSVVRKTRGKTY